MKMFQTGHHPIATRRSRHPIAVSALAAFSLLAGFTPIHAQSLAEHVELIADDGSAGDAFGSAVAIDADTAVVGAKFQNNNAGSAFIYQSDRSNNWSQVIKLTASDGRGFDRFGNAVAISGDTAIVGATGDDDFGFDSGSVYVFQRDNTGSWSELTKLNATDALAGDLFGSSVAIDGDTALIGANRVDDKGPDSGAAYIFTRSSSGTWSQAAKLTASDGADVDRFGTAVAISGDTALVGSLYDDNVETNSGSAYIYQRNAAGDWPQQVKLTATDAASGDRFGASVAIVGDVALIGALRNDDRGANSGSAYIFQRSNANWAEAQKLVAADGAAGDNFGTSVAITNGIALIGATSADAGGADAGAGYLFRINDTGSWEQKLKLVASGAADRDQSGIVAISATAALLGTPGDDGNGTDAGSAHIYQGSPSITLPQGYKLTSSSEIFEWQAGIFDVAQYWLEVGSTFGGKQYFDSGNIADATSAVVDNLATDGSTIYVRLWYRLNQESTWQYTDSSYLATGESTALTAAELVTPKNTSATTTPTYTWNAVAASTWYHLWVTDASGVNKTWHRAADAGCASGTGLCSVTPATPVSGNVTWWIQTWNNNNVGPWSTELTFIAASACGSFTGPATIAPDGNASPTPTYSWQAQCEATWYELWVNDESGTPINTWYRAEATGCAAGDGQCAITPTTAITGSATWWVRAWNSTLGNGPWSRATTFTTE